MSLGNELNGNWTTRRYANSRTGHLADWTSRGLDNSRSASWPVREISSPRVVQSASWQSASWRIRELSSNQLNCWFAELQSKLQTNQYDPMIYAVLSRPTIHVNSKPVNSKPLYHCERLVNTHQLHKCNTQRLQNATFSLLPPPSEQSFLWRTWLSQFALIFFLCLFQNRTIEDKWHMLFMGRISFHVTQPIT